jgi:hypothetical protein
MSVYPSSLKKIALGLAIALLTLGLGLGSSINFTAEAKKKATGADPAAKADTEVKKVVDPLNEQLGKLMVKVESRALLSPDEAGKLVDIKYKLVDALTQYPTSALLVRPLYQAGILFCQRESYNDAYELFSYLAQGFPATPYGLKSKGQIAQLEKRFGADYFAADGAGPATPLASPAAGAAVSAAAPAKK